MSTPAGIKAVHGGFTFATTSREMGKVKSKKPVSSRAQGHPAVARPAASRGGALSASPPKFSMRSDRVTINGFAKGTATASSFAAAHARGLPCRLVTGSVRHQLEWITAPEEAEPLTIATFVEGLVETKHPYYFVSRQGLKELLAAEGAAAKVIAVFPRVIAPLRAALCASNGEVYTAGLDALVQLSNTVGMALNPHLKLLIGQLAKNVQKPAYSERITDVLNVLETNGGSDVFKLIKAKVPTYTTACLGMK